MISKKSPDHRALDLMLNNSHSAASIARVPASHCCQLRCVLCTSADASAVESPADSRACRISSGVGLGIDDFSVVIFNGAIEAERGRVCRRIVIHPVVLHKRFFAIIIVFADNRRDMVVVFEGKYVKVHDLSPEWFGPQRAVHVRTIAYNVRACKNYFASNENIFSRAA